MLKSVFDVLFILGIIFIFLIFLTKEVRALARLRAAAVTEGYQCL